MKRESLILSAVAGTLLLSAGFSLAADTQPARDRLQTQEQDREQIYGSNLMTQQERVEHRARIRAAKTEEEREQIRKEHHEQMKLRAKERGLKLPDEPPARGNGMGPGGGMRPGGGMGPGGR